MNGSTSTCGGGSVDQRGDTPVSGGDVPSAEALLDIERAGLVAVLEGLDDAQWNAPSLCAGWRVRDVAVHLLMPYEISVPRLALRIAAARFDFDAAASRWATADPRSPAEITRALRATAQRRYRIPGAQPPLTHLVVHAGDVYRPLGLEHRIDPRSADAVLQEMTGPRFRGFLPAGLLDGLALRASDTGWSSGPGTVVVGSASALITSIAGRDAALDELSGEGALLLRTRVRTLAETSS